jgi:hypothetical protein
MTFLLDFDLNFLLLGLLHLGQRHPEDTLFKARLDLAALDIDRQPEGPLEGPIVPLDIVMVLFLFFLFLMTTSPATPVPPSWAGRT